MNSRSNNLAVLLAFAILVALAIVAFLFFQDTYHSLKALNPETIAILIVVLISALYIGLSIRRAGRSIGEQRLRLEKKAQYYEHFLQVWYKALSVSSNDTSMEKTAADELATVMEYLKLWASPQVIRQIASMQRNGTNWTKDNPNLNNSMDSLIRAMRADLGQNNLGLRPGDFGELFSSKSSEIKP